MSRKPPKGKSLAEVNPELAKQWHPTKNGDLRPYDVTFGSAKKVWWKCDKGDDHEWVTTINNRTKPKALGCPICSGQKTVLSNSLATLNPKLAMEWHPTKNGSLKPLDVSLGTNKKVWWKCDKGSDHEWVSSVSNRNKGQGCPICSNKKVVLSNCLATTNPELAKEWHPTKNGNLTPYNVVEYSNKKVWWKCDKGDDHEWITSISHRSNGRNCPICSGRRVVNSNCLANLNPNLAKEWHPSKNKNLTPYDVTIFSHQKVWWKCDKGDDHEWIASISSRSKGNGCSVCSGKTVVKSNCLSEVHPELAKEWHPTKNGSLTPKDVYAGGTNKVWWKCIKGNDHEWEANIYDRLKGRGCPICSGNKVVFSNSFIVSNPELVKEWHPTKNGKLSPYDFTKHSGQKVWWKCDKGDDHEWKAAFSDRTNGRGCPICSGHKVVLSNCLATLYPELAKQWHPTKNGSLTPKDVYAGGIKKVWWKCDKGDDHEWKAFIRSRIRGNGCPYCTLTPQSKQELSITFELKQFFDINPKGYKARVDGKITSIDIYIEEFNLGIEFDGSYWHKGKRELDKLKTEKLEKDGFTIMRVRQEPLKPITDIDIISKTPFNAKEVTDNILRHILKTYSIEKRKANRIEKYLLKNEIQNEKGLEKYIDKILTEKSRNKIQ